MSKQKNPETRVSAHLNALTYGTPGAIVGMLIAEFDLPPAPLAAKLGTSEGYIYQLTYPINSRVPADLEPALTKLAEQLTDLERTGTLRALPIPREDRAIALAKLLG